MISNRPPNTPRRRCVPPEHLLRQIAPLGAGDLLRKLLPGISWVNAWFANANQNKNHSLPGDHWYIVSEPRRHRVISPSQQNDSVNCSQKNTQKPPERVRQSVYGFTGCQSDLERPRLQVSDTTHATTRGETSNKISRSMRY